MNIGTNAKHYFVITLSHTKVLLHNKLTLLANQITFKLLHKLMFLEECDLKNVNNYLNTNIYSYLEKSGSQSSNLYLNLVHFLNTGVN